MLLGQHPRPRGPDQTLIGSQSSTPAIPREFTTSSSPGHVGSEGGCGRAPAFSHRSKGLFHRRSAGRGPPDQNLAQTRPPPGLHANRSCSAFIEVADACQPGRPAICSDLVGVGLPLRIQPAAGKRTRVLVGRPPAAPGAESWGLLSADPRPPPQRSLGGQIAALYAPAGRSQAAAWRTSGASPRAITPRHFIDRRGAKSGSPDRPCDDPRGQLHQLRRVLHCFT